LSIHLRNVHIEKKEKMTVNKILPFCLLVIALSVLSGIGRTSAPSSPADSNQFVLTKSFRIRAGNEDLLASVYTTGGGHRQKEVLSIWSRGNGGYELQYIKTAGAGETFLEPSVLEIQGMSFINLGISGNTSGHPTTVATLWMAPDTSLHEVTSQHSKALLKIGASTE
jgi:hypothetical protein